LQHPKTRLKLLAKNREIKNELCSKNYEFKKTLFVIITDYIFNNLFILAQACVNDWTLRDKITKKINHKALKSFALKETDIISMELKKHDD